MTDDGIQLLDPPMGLQTSTLTGDVAIHNGNLDIDVLPSVITGGANHTPVNGNPLQCVNVTGTRAPIRAIRLVGTGRPTSH